jgi:hypothetical protein
MRALVYLCVAVIVLAAGVAYAGEPVAKTQVPNAVLAQMGMGGMQVVPDARGETIRGKGFVAFQTSSVCNIWGKGSSTQTASGDCGCEPKLMVNGVISAGYTKSWGCTTISGTAAFNVMKF